MKSIQLMFYDDLTILTVFKGATGEVPWWDLMEKPFQLIQCRTRRSAKAVM